MALQYSVNVRNAQLDAFESAIGVIGAVAYPHGSAPGELRGR